MNALEVSSIPSRHIQGQDKCLGAYLYHFHTVGQKIFVFSAKYIHWVNWLCSNHGLCLREQISEFILCSNPSCHKSHLYIYLGNRMWHNYHHIHIFTWLGKIRQEANEAFPLMLLSSAWLNSTWQMRTLSMWGGHHSIVIVQDTNI